MYDNSIRKYYYVKSTAIFRMFSFLLCRALHKSCDFIRILFFFFFFFFDYMTIKGALSPFPQTRIRKIKLADDSLLDFPDGGNYFGITIVLGFPFVY